MKSFTTKTMAIVTAAAAALTLSACSNDDKDSSGSKETTSAARTTAAAATLPAPSIALGILGAAAATYLVSMLVSTRLYASREL